VKNAVTIEFLDKALECDEPLWHVCFPPPLEGLFWYQTLEASHLEDQFKFLYALIRVNGDPIGIAPCFLHDVPMSLIAPPAFALFLRGISKIIPSASYQRTLFVGSPCSDEGTIGLKFSIKFQDVIPALQKAVLQKAKELGASMTVFKDFRALEARQLLDAGADAYFFSMPSYPGTVIDLPKDNIEDYFRSLSQRKRYQFRKKLRLSKNILALETQIIQKPSNAELKEIVDLFIQTYERGRTKFERLSLRFFEKICEKEPVWFILQRDKSDGRLITFMLIFYQGTQVINKFIGIDYQKSGDTYLYFRLFEAALEFAYQHGARQLQSGQTGYRAKIDLGHTLVPLFNICRHVNPILNMLYGWIGKRVSWKTLDSDLAEYITAHPKSSPFFNSVSTKFTMS